MQSIDPDIFRSIYGREPQQPGAAANPLPGLRDVSPDAAAEGLREHRRTGIDAVLAAKSLPKLREEQQSMAWERFAAASPPAAAMLSAKPAAAAAAADDLPVMTQIANAVAAAARFTMGADAGGGLPGLIDRSRRAIESGVPQAAGGIAGAFAAVPGLLGMGGAERALLGARQRNVEMAAAWMPEIPADAGNIQRGYYSGLQSLGANSLFLPLALLPGGQAAALSGMGASVGGESYGKARAAGLPAFQSAAYGASDAAIEVATERFALGPLANSVKAGAQLWKSLIASTAREVPGEQVATALQDLNEWATLNPDKPFSAYLAERPGAAVQTLVATAVGTGGQVTLMHGVQKVADKITGADRQAQYAERQAQALSELATLAEASKVRTRDPETFAEFAQAVTEGHVTELHVDANVLMQSGISREELAASVGAEAAARLDEALATGGDLVIPAAEFLARAPGTAALPTILEHVRTAPEAMSAAEAKQWMSERGDAMSAEMDGIARQMMSAQEGRAGYEAVRSEVESQLRAIGRPESQAASESALLANFAATQAADLGITPQEFWQQHGASIRRAKALTAGGEVLSQNGNAITELQESDSVPAPGTVRLYHAGSDPVGGGYFKEVPSGGVFNGMFALKSGWGNYGTGAKYFSDIAEERVLTQHAIEYEIGYSDVKAALVDAMPWLDESDIDEAWTAVVEDKAGALDEDNLMRIFREDSVGAASWEAQRIRGAVAKRLGFQAVEMDDENGTSWLIVAGTPLTRVTPNEAAAQSDAGNILEQARQGTRGFFSPGSNTITLLSGADLSTFLHEAGHYFFQSQIDIAAGVIASQKQGAQITDGEQRIIDRVHALMTWHGLAGSLDEQLTAWYSMSFEEQRGYHERTAESFEAYLFSGQAPSIELQGAFRQFRSWLISVYKSLRDFIAGNPEAGKLSDEVRGVFDRMIASEQAIAEAQTARAMGPLFETAAMAGMTPEQWVQYQALGQQAAGEAVDALQAKGLRDMQWLDNARSKRLAEMQRSMKAQRRVVRMEARAEIMMRPVYQAWQSLTGVAPKANEKSAAELESRAAIEAWKQARSEAEAGFLTAEREALLALNPQAKGLERGQLLARSKREIGLHVQLSLVEWEKDNPQPELVQTPREDVEPGTIGKLDEEFVKKLQPGYAAILKARRMLGKEGAAPDVAAEVFGFTSGDELVRSLAEAAPPSEAIEELANRMMLERFGDLASEEGLRRAVDEALHSDARGRMIATELDALAAASPKERDARGRRTVDVMANAAKQYAAGLVARLRVRDLQPARYQAAEARAAREGAKAFRAGDTDAAIAAKRAELVQSAAAREAMQARAEMEKARAYLSRMAAGPKSIPLEYREQIDALLEKHDLKVRSDAAADKRASMAAWMQSQLKLGHIPQFAESLLSAQEAQRYRADLQSRDEAGDLIYEDDADVARRLAEGIERSQATPWRELTVEQARGLVDAVKQIEHLGRLKGKLLANRDGATYEAVRDEIVAGIVEFGGTPATVAKQRTRNDKLGAAWQAVTQFAASHIKVSTWARRMDGGKDNGAVWRNIVRPANERASWESTQRGLATEALSAILRPVIKKVSVLDMSGRGTYFATIGDSLNWQERFSVLLNMGNEGNIQRLLDGNGWTMAQIEPILATFTAEEARAAQAVWDYMDSFRPQIAELERRTAGREPEWVQPMPLRVQTSDGPVDLRGGYFPIRYDPRTSARADSLASAEEAKQLMSAANIAATTRKGYTKQRAAEVRGRPILLNLHALYGGVNDVIHDLAWREWLMDTGKILRSDSVQESMRAHYGPEVAREFKRWMEDIAAGSRRLDHGIERAVGFVRQNVSAAALTYNLLTAATQLLGLSNSMARVGSLAVAGSFAAYAGSPLRMTREAMAKSEFLRNRTRTRFRELNELRNAVQGQTTAKELMGRYGYWLMMRTQLMVDVPTWWAAHDKALADGLDEGAAVAIGDQAVKDAQGGGEEVDQAGIERGGPMVKLFTAFYGFMNTTLNVTYLAATDPGSKAKKAATLALVLMVPAVLTALLKSALIPGGDDDDSEKLARKLAAEQLSFMFGMVAFGREFSFMAKELMGEHAFPYTGPAGLRAITDVQKLAKQTKQGEFDDAFAKSFVNVLGDLTGIPSVQINRTIAGVTAIDEGKVEGPVDSARALAFGFERGK